MLLNLDFQHSFVTKASHKHCLLSMGKKTLNLDFGEKCCKFVVQVYSDLKRVAFLLLTT